MEMKAQVIEWLKDNNLTDMKMQLFPPDGWMWIEDRETKTFALFNRETNETITFKDFLPNE
jgi:hypothetical protein